MSTQVQPSDDGWVPASSFGSRLLEVRRHLNLTAEELAERCDVPVVTWRRWEKGAHPRDLAAVVRAVRRETGVDHDWLMWGTDLPKRENWCYDPAAAA